MLNWLQKQYLFPKIQNAIWFLLFVCLVFFLNIQNTKAQSNNLQLQQDSIYKYFPDHSPSKATWMSMALPGLGQYYNGQYWKIPIIYAGFSTLVFFVSQNKYEYNRYREAYAIKVELPENQTSDNLLVNTYDADQLLSQREFYQSNLELSYILTGAFYILQIVDAAVDANLYDYDIDDDLSIRIEPQWVPSPEGVKIAPCIALRWKLGIE